MEVVPHLSFPELVFPFTALFMIYAVNLKWLNFTLNKSVPENLQFKTRELH